MNTFLERWLGDLRIWFGELMTLLKRHQGSVQGYEGTSATALGPLFFECAGLRRLKIVREVWEEDSWAYQRI